jgi:hypothetical protein
VATRLAFAATVSLRPRECGGAFSIAVLIRFTSRLLPRTLESARPANADADRRSTHSRSCRTATSYATEDVPSSGPFPKRHPATCDSRSFDSCPEKLTTRPGSPWRLTTATKPERGEETDAKHILSSCS